MADRQKKAPDLERGLPENADAERMVLGSILLDDAIFPQVAGTLAAGDFSLRSHQLIFRRMADLQGRGERIDRVTVANELMKFTEIEACGGISYLVSLDEGLPRIPNADSYARLVKEKSRLRRLVFTAQHTMNRAMVGEEDSSTIVTSARESFLAIEAGADDDGPQTIDQIIQGMGGMNVLLGPPKQGLHTGLVKLDEMTGGLHGGDFTILAARPSVGKTALGVGIAQHAALKLHKTPMIFSLEMSKGQLLHRMLCATARVDSQRVRLGYLSMDERKRLALAAAQLAATRILIDDKSASTAADLHARIRRRMAEEEVHLVIVDYLQLMSAGRSYENKNQEVTAISRGLKLLAGELKIPLLVLSQLNREVDKRKGDHRPQLGDLRESGSLEQDADVVLFLVRPEMYDKDREELRGHAELIIGKQRNGPVGTVNLVYLHNLTKFESRAEDTGDDAPPPLLEHEYSGSTI